MSFASTEEAFDNPLNERFLENFDSLTLDRFAWYRGDISRQEAEKFLEKNSPGYANGLFIVRESKGKHVLSWKMGRKKGHTVIFRQPDGMYAFDVKSPPPAQPSVQRLVTSESSQAVLGSAVPYGTGPSPAVQVQAGNSYNRLQRPGVLAPGQASSLLRPKEGLPPPPTVVGQPTAQGPAMPGADDGADSPPTLGDAIADPPTQKLEGCSTLLLQQQFELEPYEGSDDSYRMIRYMEKGKAHSAAFPVVQTNWDGQNKYIGMDQNDKPMLLLVEQTAKRSSCLRECLGIYRPFLFEIYINEKTPVATLSRGFGCHSCCCFSACCLMPSVAVKMGDWQIGRIHQPFLAGMFKPTYLVDDQGGDTKFKIVGDFLLTRRNVAQFQIMQREGGSWVTRGRISRRQRYLHFEMATDADNFSLQFPEKATVEDKINLLAATVLIDFVQFEGQASATTTGRTNVMNDGPRGVNVEDRPCYPFLGCCDAYCCGCVCRC